MVKSKTSDAYEDKRFYDTQREGFRKIAEQAEASDSRSIRNRYIAETARAAEQLVGTERARELINDGMYKNLKADISLTDDTPTVSTSMGILENMLDNGSLNKPLGSRLSNNEFQAIKDAVQSEYAALEAKGYTRAEVAAALAYERNLVRDGEQKQAKSSNMVTTYRNGKPEQVPRFRKSANGSKTANTYTTKQFVPYTGTLLQAGSMTYNTGKASSQMYRIADIHKGIHGAWLEGANNGNGFAVNVFKDGGGWYMEHSRLGHFDADGNWTERYYLEDLRKRVGF